MSKASASWCKFVLATGYFLAADAFAADPLLGDSFGTMADVEAKESGLADAIEQAKPRGDQTSEVFESVSSFPVRMVYGSEDQDTWDGLAQSATHPTPLSRWYSANNCKFALVAEKFAVNMKRVRSGLIKDTESIGPQNVIYVEAKRRESMSISTVLGVKIKEGTEKFCRKTFAGKKIRFAMVTLEGGNLYLENRAGQRVTIAETTNDTATKVYLNWDDEQKTLLATDRAGVVVGLESSTYSLPVAIEGIYYLHYQPAWTVERVMPSIAFK